MRNVASALNQRHLSFPDFCLLRQFAVLAGIQEIIATHSGLQGLCVDGERFMVSLVVLPTGEVELRCISGKDAGSSAVVSSLDELRQGQKRAVQESL